MIREEEVYQIGSFVKPHGFHGELLFSFTNDIFDRVDCDYIVCRIDGILVPFFIKEYRFKSDTTALFTLKGIDTDEKASFFTDTPVFFPKKYIDECDDNEVTLEYFKGFTIEDKSGNVVGTIQNIDDSTANILFGVEHKGKEILVPAQEDLIEEVNHNTRTITMSLPKGLLELFKD